LGIDLKDGRCVKMKKVWIWPWQAEIMAKFLRAAAKRTDFIYVCTEGEEIILEAQTETERPATLRVSGDPRPKVTCVDEWGLTADLE
jgi:hypothetical protein